MVVEPCNFEAVHSFAGGNSKCEVEVVTTVTVLGDRHGHAGRGFRPGPALTVRRASCIGPTIVAIARTRVVVVIVVIAVAALKAGQNHIPEREIGAAPAPANAPTHTRAMRTAPIPLSMPFTATGAGEVATASPF